MQLQRESLRTTTCAPQLAKWALQTSTADAWQASQTRGPRTRAQITWKDGNGVWPSQAPIRASRVARLAAISGVSREGAESRMSPATGSSTLSGVCSSVWGKITPECSVSAALSSPLLASGKDTRCAALASRAGAARLRSMVPKNMKPALLRASTFVYCCRRCSYVCSTSHEALLRRCAAAVKLHRIIFRCKAGHTATACLNM